MRKNLIKLIDNWIEGKSRAIAQNTSRRSFLTRAGSALVGASVFPLLPVARAASLSQSVPDDALISGSEGDPLTCDYWRYCGIDGTACACCGGTVNSCPPGTELSNIAWIGTCRNPLDNKHYIISYNDCCGKKSCGRCFCTRNDGDLPIYQSFRSNDITWCFGTDSNVYHCTMAVAIGVAQDSK